MSDVVKWEDRQWVKDLADFLARYDEISKEEWDEQLARGEVEGEYQPSTAEEREAAFLDVIMWELRQHIGDDVRGLLRKVSEDLEDIKGLIDG